MRLCETVKKIPVIEPQDHAAGVTGESICMKDAAHLTLTFLFGELTGDATLIIYEGATDGAETSALTFSYRYTGADLKNDEADTLGSESTSAELDLTAATFEDRMLVVEIDANELTDGYDWVTPVISSDATEEFVSCEAELSGLRYAEDVPPTAIS